MQTAHDLETKYTYKDYLSWHDEERWEVINGLAWNMSPAPTVRHQRIVGNLHGILFQANSRFPGCVLFIAPTDVVFDDINIVQPDMFVVCDQKKISAKNIQGVPELIFEVISPPTAAKDKREKKELYEKFGVREYVVVFPENEMGADTLISWAIGTGNNYTSAKKIGRFIAPKCFCVKVNCLHCHG